MEVIKKLLPVGHPNRPGTKLESLKAIVVHYTANERLTATDTANINYIGRKWENGKYMEGRKTAFGPIEFGSVGDNGYGTAFRYGSAHIFADHDSVSMAIPTDEVAWACGDRPLPWTALDKGQKPIARIAFANRQNYRSVSVEICNNDVLPGREDWWLASANAKEWIILFLKERGLRVDVQQSLDPKSFVWHKEGEIMILRHHDITGKSCPKPFIDNCGEWASFVRDIAASVT